MRAKVEDEREMREQSDRKQRQKNRKRDPEDLLRLLEHLANILPNDSKHPVAALGRGAGTSEKEKDAGHAKPGDEDPDGNEGSELSETGGISEQESEETYRSC